MAALSLLSHNAIRNQQHRGVLVEEIEGLIKVYKDGRVERPPIIPNVPCTSIQPELRVTSRDIIIDRFTNLSVRVYAPQVQGKVPVLVYFHGGGFCVGSASWSCYHNFTANLASKVGCVVVSVNYRLAPENRLPAAYDDGYNTIMWVKQQAAYGGSNTEHSWWLSRCNLSSFFLAGDSAGANIAHNVTLKIAAETGNFRPVFHKGTILIQPFFGGETRTASEKVSQPQGSALTLSAADTYWRLSLPVGSNRDHPWCNPLVNGASKLKGAQLPATMVCISDMDILMDRNIEFCSVMANAGKTVKIAVYKGVGHAFQILNSSHHSKSRTQEMIAHIKAFINN
ncbi:probable carboxylesterase 17 [Amaranthus tricolor]|uniref:probable carboxylesterase 17 n=1 Tax=Amaranthus tricolor TaxID=29722 RepID=UPI002585D0EA|nr:probable carboxylesterase 17 [Amaranthus tricolor]